MDDSQTPNAKRDLHIVLREGFRGHTIVIVVDGREVYRRSGVTTDVQTSHADTIDVAAVSRRPRIAVSVTPGDLVASLDLDVGTYRHLAISLVGEATLSFETYGLEP